MSSHEGSSQHSRATDRGRDALRRAYLSGEAACAVFFGVVGAVGLVAASSMSVAQGHDPLGGRFFPLTISISLVVGAAVVLATPLLRYLLGRTDVAEGAEEGARGAGREDAQTETAPAADAPGRAKPFGRVLAMAGVSIVYVALLDLIGYIPATIIGMAGALWVLGVRRPRSLLVGPTIMSLSVYYIFTTFLFVRLP